MLHDIIDDITDTKNSYLCKAFWERLGGKHRKNTVAIQFSYITKQDRCATVCHQNHFYRLKSNQYSYSKYINYKT